MFLLVYWVISVRIINPSLVHRMKSPVLTPKFGTAESNSIEISKWTYISLFIAKGIRTISSRCGQEIGNSYSWAHSRAFPDDDLIPNYSNVTRPLVNSRKCGKKFEWGMAWRVLVWQMCYWRGWLGCIWQNGGMKPTEVWIAATASASVFINSVLSCWL